MYNAGGRASCWNDLGDISPLDQQNSTTVQKIKHVLLIYFLFSKDALNESKITVKTIVRYKCDHGPQSNKLFFYREI